ncbi:hypothetical protein C1634_025535 [Chryseobacterium viscerum]|uniref:Uncharacterized protein n=1 Tax=Chryseobacterium viscerum TaxID=1037377 RepID=A0A316WC56_9FLAO|nr:hypothetical protein C1634_025535 [Chryseobacterium viscerum]
MPISYYDFKNLTDKSQLEIVMTEGKIINELIKHELRFVLYEVSSFSVEIVYNMLNNRIESFTSFQNKRA